MARNTLKVLTYNIHKGFNPTNRQFILHDIKESIRQVDADLLLLQEIHGERNITKNRFDDWPSNNQFEYLADEIWEHHAYGKNAIYKSGHHGNAILSKFPFIEWENIDVSFMRSASRSLLHGTIDLVESRHHIHVICVHLGLFGMERQRQLATLVSRIDSHVPHHSPLIIAGDFNDWLGRAEKHFTEDLGVQEVFKASSGKYARTFPGWLPALSMDRIYTRGLDLLSCQRLHGHPWRKLSDHIPLMAEFQLSN
ncbi:MAG: EEP domain-containing protein [Gammaproteobacteria bacterium]|nr:EEP domain-containing protein [Gammaproteobacteria bacterium]